MEIEYGLLQAENTKRSCVWFHRIINGLEPSEDGDNAEVLKYTDHCPDGVCLNDGTHPQALLHNLKSKKMKEAMHVENIFTYNATWTPKGNNIKCNNDLNIIIKMIMIMIMIIIIIIIIIIIAIIVVNILE